MMKMSTLYACVLFAGTFGCHRALGPYCNTSRWLLSDADDDRQPLRGHPKEVRQYKYPVTDTGNPERLKGQCDRFGFNAGGDLIWQKSYVHDTLSSTWNARYDSNGCQWVFLDLATGKSFPGATYKLGDGRYKEIGYNRDSPTVTTVIYGFSTDGSELYCATYKDTAAQHKMRDLHFYYNGIRIIKFEIKGGESDAEKRFYYSRSDIPDSSEVRSTGLIPIIVRRDYFVNNRAGDPIRHIRLLKKDTVLVEHFEYLYDEHGNWVRKITTVLKDVQKAKVQWDWWVPKVVEREFLYQ